MNRLNLKLTVIVILTSLSISIQNSYAILDTPNIFNSISGDYCGYQTWFTTAPGATWYEVQHSTDINFISNVRSDTAFVSPFILPVLPFGETYYVRVRAMNPTDSSLWSNVRTKLTQTYPSNIYPYDTQTNVKIDTVLICDTRSCVTKVWYEIDTTASFNSPLFQHFEMTDPFQRPQPFFNFCQKYYYRCKYATSVDTIDWCPVVQFTTVCNAQIVSPNGTTSPVPYEKLFFNKISGVLKYEIQIDTLSDFSTARTETMLQTEPLTYKEVYNLFFGKQHFWRLRSISAVDTSDWTNSFSFYVSELSLISPADNITELPPFAQLNAYNMVYVNGYIFQIDTVSTFNSPAFQEIQSATQGITLHNLYFGKTYYWRAMTFHQLDSSNYSTTRTFRITDNVTLLQPLNGTVVSSGKAKLYVNTIWGVSTFEYQVSEDSLFATGQITMLNHNESNNFVETTYLEFGKIFYWRARYIHPTDTSSWSDPWHINTINSPALIGPLDNTTDIPTYVSLNWISIQNINGYLVYLDTNSLFDNPMTYIQPQWGNVLYIGNLQPQKTYYWKVLAFHPNDTSDWSDTWSFTTGSFSYANPSYSEKPNKNLNIYPNPTSSEVIIEYINNNKETTELRILSTDGKYLYLRTLFKGRNIMTIQTKEWSKGTAIVEIISSNTKIESKRIMLIEK